MVRLATRDENFGLAYALFLTRELLFKQELTFDDLVNRLKEEEEKVQTELIKLYLNENLNRLGDVRPELRKIKDLPKKLDDVEKAGAAGKVKEVFDEIANMTIFRIFPFNPNFLEIFNGFVGLLEKENTSSLAPLMNLLNLEPINTLEIIRCLDSLVKDKYLDIKQMLHLMGSSYVFATFMFLFVHAAKRGLEGREVLNELGLYHWDELRKSLREELLVYFIIPLSFSKPRNMEMGLTVAKLLTNLGRHHDMKYVEEICRGLQNMEKYGPDELVNRMISYAYFYGDSDAIIKLGELAKVNRSLEKALHRLTGQKHMPVSRSTLRAQRPNS